jgi:hypothetical protein
MFDLDQFTAQNERFFADHWLDTAWIQNAARRSVPIIFGAKGGGKSALLRYLTELRHEPNIGYSNIDLSDFRHERVRSQVRALVGDLSIDHGTLLANYWRYLLLLHCLRHVAVRSNPTNDQERLVLERVRAVLARQEPADSASNMLLGCLIKARQFLDGCLLRKIAADEPPLVGGLTRRELARLENHPDDDEFTTACIDAAGLVRAAGQHVGLVVDGLDSVDDSDRRAHSFILGSIVTAVKRLALDQSLNEAFSVKLLVPRELFFDIKDRDLDQYVALQSQLYWDPEDLLGLLQKRITAAAQRAGLASGVSLSDLVPERLPDGQLTFEFFLRHTMYRPRQLLLYFKAIADLERWPVLPPQKWQSANGARIVGHVRAQTHTLANNFLQEFSVKYPRLETTLQKLAGLSSVVGLGELRSRFTADPELLLRDLYDCGAIGIIELEQPILGRDPSGCYRIVNGQQQPISCEFSYKSGSRLQWLPAMPDETLIAIHPMLIRFCGVSSNPEFVVG